MHRMSLDLIYGISTKDGSSALFHPNENSMFCYTSTIARPQNHELCVSLCYESKFQLDHSLKVEAKENLSTREKMGQDGMKRQFHIS